MAKNEKDDLPPHWKLDGYVKRCSFCGYPFPENVLSIDQAFKEHMKTAHRPGQTSEDISQAAARVVREATKD